MACSAGWLYVSERKHVLTLVLSSCMMGDSGWGWKWEVGKNGGVLERIQRGVGL